MANKMERRAFNGKGDKMECKLRRGIKVAFYSITSQHWKFASEKKCIDFRNWLKEVHGEVFEISAGEFKESGTSISTMAVVIKNNSK